MSKQEDSKDPPDLDTSTKMQLRNRKQGAQKSKDSKGATSKPETVEERAETTPPPVPEPQQLPPQPQYIQPEIIYVPANRFIFTVPKWLCYTVLAILAVLFIGMGGYIGDVVYKKYYGYVPRDPNAAIASVIGEEGSAFFRQYDRDADGKLTMDEYEAMYYRLLGEGVNITKTTEFIQLIDDDDEVITAKAYFQPLVLDTMTKDMNESFLSDSLDSLTGLKAWNKLSVELLNFGVQHFKSFLPNEESFINNVGTVYDIYKLEEGLFAAFDTQMTSSNRYYPSKLEERLIVMQRLISMFHPRPFLRTRFPPQGAVATVRAYNDKYLDIIFRIHAEFQLNEPPYYPFWFTPAQFTGHLIISRDYKHILHFHMYVPTDKKLNIDMEWLNGPQESENMEVDIGFLPQMEIKITAPSKKVPKKDKDLPIPDDKEKTKLVQSLKWTKEISDHEAHRNLEIKMYPFKKVVYHNFTDAFEEAKKENKLVHHILLWGALDDQSC